MFINSVSDGFVGFKACFLMFFGFLDWLKHVATPPARGHRLPRPGRACFGPWHFLRRQVSRSSVLWNLGSLRGFVLGKLVPKGGNLNLMGIYSNTSRDDNDITSRWNWGSLFSDNVGNHWI
jgi:hypothetical protein